MERLDKVEDLEVFKKSHQLALKLYSCTKEFPPEEKFGLIPQIRRAAFSVPANLIEGSHRSSRAEYRHFVSIARGSIGELKYLILLSRDLGYISTASYDPLQNEIDEISRMLSGLIKSLSKARSL